MDLKKVHEYSHLGGSEILKHRFPSIDREVDDVIASIRLAEKTKVSKEKTMKGKLLYSPKLLNRLFTQEFRSRGWKELRSTYDIVLENYNVRIRGAFKQIDFAKDRILVEVQLGKYAFMFYDMAKFQYFYNESKAELGVEIVPSHPLHKQMSTGVSYGEQLVYDIERLRRNFPAVPVKVILLDVEPEGPRIT